MTAAPITELSEEERIFRETVREFAESRIRPRVPEMERERCQPPELIAELFELGLMGIEIPESYGGAGATFFMTILAIEEVSRVDPALAIPVDVQNTLVVKLICAGAARSSNSAFSACSRATRSAPTRSRRRARAAMRLRSRRARNASATAGA